MNGMRQGGERVLDGAQGLVDWVADLLDRVVWCFEGPDSRGRRPARTRIRRPPALGVGASIMATCAVLIALGLIAVHPSPAQANGGDPLAVSVLLTDHTRQAALTPQQPLEFSSGASPAAGTPVITVNDYQRDQTISGFGAALTDSSADLIEHHLTPIARIDLMSSLFAPSGIGLTSIRVPVGASDYTAAGQPYSYDDGAADPGLKRFSIGRDMTSVLPLLRQARSLDRDIAVLATPWTAPAWMKANHAFDDLGGKGTLLPADLGVYAAYLVRFLQAYASAGVPVSALTPANEPGNFTSYPGMNLPAATEARLLSRYLVPALTRAKLKVSLYGADTGWASGGYARALATSPSAGSLAGLAWHCYYGGPEVMAALHYQHPKLAEMLTECSPGISTEPIAEIVIAALRNWATGVDLWNVALDPRGGPVQQPNTGCGGCSGLVTVDPKTQTFSYTGAYDQLGQASQVIAAGAVRVDTNSFVGYDYLKPSVRWASAGIDDVAVQNPDGSLALLAYNTGSSAETFAIHWHTYYLSYTLDPGATVSFRWRRP